MNLWQRRRRPLRNCAKIAIVFVVGKTVMATVPMGVIMLLKVYYVKGVRLLVSSERGVTCSNLEPKMAGG